MRKNLKLLALSLVFCMTAAVSAGCAPVNGYGLKTKGTLTVGTDIGYPPFEMYDVDGKTETGFDIDLARAIAGILELDVKFIDTTFDTILDGLDANDYDIVMSSLTITEERKQKVDFSSPYITNWQTLVVRKGVGQVSSFREYAGKRITCQMGTTSQAYIEELNDTENLSYDISPYEKIEECFDELKSGNCDAVLCDNIVAESYVNANADSFEIAWIQSSDPEAVSELFGIAVKKGNVALLNAVNEALNALEQSGELDALRKKWLSIA